MALYLQRWGTGEARSQLIDLTLETPRPRGPRTFEISETLGSLGCRSSDLQMSYRGVLDGRTILEGLYFGGFKWASKSV